MTTNTDTKAPNSVRHLPSFAQTLRDEADKCDLFGINRPAELLRDAAAIIAEAQPDHIPGAGKMVQPVAVPQGATHYQPHQKAYYQRVSATEWRLWSDRYGWMQSKGTSDSSEWVTLEQIAAAPAAPAPALVPQELPDPLGCNACTHPACARYDGPRRVECRAMADEACGRPTERAHGIGGQS